MTVEEDYPINFGSDGVSPAHTPGEAAVRFGERLRTITNYNASLPLGTTLLKNEQLCLTVAIAKLEQALLGCKGVDDPSVQAVNAIIRGWRVQSEVGTNIDNPVPDAGKSLPLSDIPIRAGEYDVVLRGLITIAYRYRSLLEEATYAHILHNLLNQRGSYEHIEFVTVGGVSTPLPETENHILMIASSRYLTNQLLCRETTHPDPTWNNETTGFTLWMLERLQRLLKFDFEEYNARPYQTYSTMALCNLHDFAEDDRVRRGARMVLDYKAAKFAVSSNELRRSVPFRRRKEFKDSTGLLDNHSDPDTFRFLILTGLSDRLADQPDKMHAPFWPRDMMQVTAVCTYRVPRLILDLIMTPRHRRFYQRFMHGGRHGGMEVYVGSPSFLLSAGGSAMESVHGGDEYNGYDDAGWAMPTTVMPTGSGITATISSASTGTGKSASAPTLRSARNSHVDSTPAFPHPIRQ